MTGLAYVVMNLKEKKKADDVYTSDYSIRFQYASKTAYVINYSIHVSIS